MIINTAVNIYEYKINQMIFFVNNINTMKIIYKLPHTQVNVYKYIFVIKKTMLTTYGTHTIG